jgi:hypothetical protein
MRKKLLKIPIYLLLFLAVERFCYYQTAGFAVNKISSTHILDEEGEEFPLSDEEQNKLAEILGQKFRFLGSGGSFYAFVSEDDHYVVKFFKHHHLNRDPVKKRRLIRSVKAAFASFKEETGLLFIRLHKTPYFPSSLTIIDKMGIEHKIDLNKTEFLVQKKADMITQKIVRLAAQSELASARQLLSHLAQFCKEMTQKLNEKGYFDHDPNFLTNYGVIGDQIIKIDVGPFYSLDDPKAKSQLDKLKMQLNCFNKFLHKNYPELAPSFEGEVEKGGLLP